MASSHPQVFLSYRRSDSAEVIGRIYDRLIQSFGPDAIFKDIDSIPLGVDFRTHIDQTVSACKILIAVIGQQWLNVTDVEGRRRLEQPDDFVRIEIESALARDIPVIPILLSGTTMPSEPELPISLGPLAYRNGMSVRPDPDFHHDMDRLIAGLATQLGINVANPNSSDTLAQTSPTQGAAGINISAGGNVGNISGIVVGDVNGIINLGTIHGDVTHQSPQRPESLDSTQPSFNALLRDLQAAIGAEIELDQDDKVEALAQVTVLAKASQNPQDSVLQRDSKTALKILKGTISILPVRSQLVRDCETLLPAIASVIGQLSES